MFLTKFQANKNLTNVTFRMSSNFFQAINRPIQDLRASQCRGLMNEFVVWA